MKASGRVGFVMAKER